MRSGNVSVLYFFECIPDNSQNNNELAMIWDNVLYKEYWAVLGIDVCSEETSVI